MNNRLYGNLIFELSHPGRRGYSLPRNQFGHHELPAELRRKEDAQLPECDELTVVRHYTMHLWQLACLQTVTTVRSSMSLTLNTRATSTLCSADSSKQEYLEELRLATIPLCLP